MSEYPTLKLADLQAAVLDGVAIRAVLRLQPAAGKGAKVFPSTYGTAQDKLDEKRFGETKYATEDRNVDGETVKCVLLDSVASQANRMEQVLLSAWRDHAVNFPVIRVDFTAAELPEPIGEITTLDAPHRVYDAIFRDSIDQNNVLFRYTDCGKQITAASSRDATALYRYCPTALVFGAWDSTGPKGGMGSKFPRAISSEIVAINAQLGTRVASRVDPLQISKVMDVAYKVEGSEGWTTQAPDKKAKSVAPSEINHGNVTPTRDKTNGGVTFDYARQTTVLSLPAIRRLRFARNTLGETPAEPRKAAQAAHVALVALAVVSIAHAHHAGHDLRSGTLLVGEGPLVLEILGSDGKTMSYRLNHTDASALLNAAAAAAAEVGMDWVREPIAALKPAPKLVHLLMESQKHQAAKAAQSGEDA